MIICVAGKKRSGKDTVAKYFVEKGFIKLELAKFLKEALLAINPILPLPEITISNFRYILIYIWTMVSTVKIPRYTDLLRYINKDDIKDIFPDVRYFLQYVGTDLVLTQDKYFWINALINQVSNYPAGTNFVISDVRFDHEIDRLRELGFDFKVVMVCRDTVQDKNSTHISENGINYSYIDSIIYNNLDIDHLYRLLSDFLKSILS